MTKDELQVVVKRGIKGLSAYFVAAEYGDAIDAAERDTGFTLPTTVAFRISCFCTGQEVIGIAAASAV